MRADYEKMSNQSVWFSTYKHSGEQVCPMQPFKAPPTLAGPWGDNAPARDYSRPHFANMLLRQVRRCGIPIIFGKRAVEYYDYKSIPKAGVVTQDGERFEAEIVIAADGIGSKSQELLFDPDERSRSIGKALYRAGYDTERGLADPVVRKYFAPPNDTDSTVAFMVGPDAHAVVHVDQKMMAWAFVHTVLLPSRFEHRQQSTNSHRPPAPSANPGTTASPSPKSSAPWTLLPAGARPCTAS